MFVVGGECLIDLVSQPRQPGELINMHAHAGGSPYNCAIALAKLGNDTGYLCPISKDAFGDYLLAPLKTAGVRALLEERVSAPSTLAVVTLDERGKAEYAFHRGADRAFTRDGLIAALPEKPTLYQVGGFCPIEPVDAAIWRDVVDAAISRGAVISIDPNVRPSLVDDFDAYKARLNGFLDQAHIIKMSDEDLMLLDRNLSVSGHAEALLARPNCQLVVVSKGEGGSEAFTQSGHATAEIYAPSVFGDTVGAGDSLMAGVLTGVAARGDLSVGNLNMLDNAALSEILQFAAVVAGLNCGHKGCNPPTLDEVNAALSA